MLNKMKSTILYSRIECATSRATGKVKDTAKSVKNNTNVKTVAKAACTVATVASSVNAGACIAKMAVKGVSGKLATATAVHTAKAVAFNGLKKEINKKDNQ